MASDSQLLGNSRVLNLLRNCEETAQVPCLKDNMAHREVQENGTILTYVAKNSGETQRVSKPVSCLVKAVTPNKREMNTSLTSNIFPAPSSPLCPLV
jgi:hypothetical protein